MRKPFFVPARTLRLAKGGFTLVEVMVAVSIFTIIMTLGVSALLATTSAASQTRADRKSTDSLSVFFEHASRTIRTGYGFTTTGQDEISFTTQEGAQDEYIFNPTAGTITYSHTPVGGSTRTVTVASPARGLTLSSVQFILVNDDANDGKQPMVRILVYGTATDRRRESQFILQTAISPRVLQIGGSQGV